MRYAILAFVVLLIVAVASGAVTAWGRCHRAGGTLVAGIGRFVCVQEMRP